MNLPTTTPNERDLAWYVRECESLNDRNRVLAAEVDQWAARCAAAIYMLPETVTGGQLREAQDKFHRERENLRRENAALRADIHAHEQINKQLIEDKRRLDWLLTDDGGFWVNWMYDKDEWTPELKASRDAIDACRNGRIGREKP